MKRSRPSWETAAEEAILPVSPRSRSRFRWGAVGALEEIGRELKLDKSTVSRRVRQARRAGYLENLELRDRQRARISRTAEPLPDPKSGGVLPTSEALEAAWKGRKPRRGRREAP